MQTLILPGYSLKNKGWAEEIKRQLDDKLTSKVIYWPHWETGQSEDNWIEKEAEKIIGTIHGGNINLIAKSIGTMVAMIVLKRKQELVNRLILCGIPLNDFLPGNEKYYEVLKGFLVERILCIQNSGDNHGSHPAVEKFIQAINPEIRVVSKERDDHEYPYPEDFIDFLLG